MAGRTPVLGSSVESHERDASGVIATVRRAPRELGSRLTVALAGDEGALSALLAEDVSGWWARGTGLAGLDGREPLTRALLRLVQRTPPTRYVVRESDDATAIVTGFAGEAFAWSLELRVERGAIVGIYVRGATLAG